MNALTDSETQLLQRHFQDQCYLNIPLEQFKNYKNALEVLLAITSCKSIEELISKEFLQDSEILDLVFDIFAAPPSEWNDLFAFENLLINKVLPDVFNGITKEQNSRKIRIWHTFCRSGVDLYKYAMMIEKFIEENQPENILSENIEYIGTDISPSMLFMASAGRYSHKSLQTFNSKLKNSFFEDEENIECLNEYLKNKTHFFKRNLLSPLKDLGTFDIVLYKTPSNYISSQGLNLIKENIELNINPGGFLLPEDELSSFSIKKHTHDNLTYYQK